MKIMKKHVFPFIFLAFLALLFQNCNIIGARRMEGTVVTNPFQTKKAELKFSSFSSHVNQVDMCLTNILLRLKDVQNDQAAEEISQGVAESGFDVAYYYMDAGKYFVNGLVTTKELRLSPNGTLIGNFEVPKGIYDFVAFGFSSCKSRSSIEVVNNNGEFSDRPENYFALVYEGDRDLHSSSGNTFEINFLTDSLVNIASNPQLQDVLQPYRRFDVIGFGTKQIIGFKNIDLDSVVSQSDGKVITSGRAGDEVNNFGHIVLSRFNLDGSVDSTFGNNGVAAVDSENIFLTNSSTAIAADDSIFLLTHNYLNAQADMGIIKLTKDGAIDNTFNGGEWRNIDSGAINDYADKILLLDDGKIIVVGKNDKGKLIFAKLLPDGRFDSSFGNNGIFKYSYIAYGYEDKVALELQSDGKIVAATTYNRDSGQDWMIIRLTQNGAIDTTFNPSSSSPGRVFVSFGYNTAGFLYDVIVAPDDKIIAVGRMINDSKDFAIARLLPHGEPDGQFGDVGKVTYDFGGEDIAKSCILDNDNRIVVTGQVEMPNAFAFGLLGLNENGNPDTSISSTGTRLFSLQSGTSGGIMTTRPDGTISIGGTNGSSFYLLSLSK